MKVDPRHLRMLLTVAEHGSFTLAAAAHGISQPAMSSGIALLEKQLGARVLERGRHGARPNELGELLLRHARGLEALLEQAKAEIDLRRAGAEGPLLIGGTPVTLIELVPAAVEEIARGNNRIAVTVLEGGDENLLAKLRAGEIDVMVSGIGQAPPPDIAQEVLTELPFDAVVNARHPLAGRKIMRLKDLAGAQWALPTPDNAFHRHLQAIFLAAGVPFPDSAWSCGSLLALKSMVIHASCVSILPRNAIALEARTKVLRSIRLSDVRSRRQIGASTLRTRAPSPTAGRFLAVLRSVARAI
jgi:DNA-binding transcriptional LysR family regulator